MKETKQRYSHHVSVPSKEGVRVDKVVTIERPVAEVYSFWRQLENFPRFMRHLKSISVQDELHSHWAIRTLGGKTLEWDAEIIEQRENEMISWRSAPGADLDNAGSVWFVQVPGGQGTIVKLEMKYDPPAGKTGAFVAKLFGRDAEAEIGEDLSRLKMLLETGHLPEAKTIVRSEQRTLRQVRRTAQSADIWIRQNPWEAVACSIAAGFFIGFLFSHRR